MDARARDAADQLVRLTRLVLRAGGVPPTLDDAPRAVRVLRHNGAELTAPERHVLGLIVAGRCTTRLASVLEVDEAVVADHLRAVLADFALPEEPPPPGPARVRRRGALTLLVVPCTATLLVGGAAAAVALQRPPERPAPTPHAVPRPHTGRHHAAHGPRAAAAGTATSARQGSDGGPATGGTTDPATGGGPLPSAPPGTAARPAPGRPPTGSPAFPARRGRRLPRGVATATSFWDAATARGARMSTRTVASPYWPLGTRVRISYRGRTAYGVVQDFGPAAWAVAQHDPPAILDLSEPMMARLTGRRVHAVPVRFEVLAWGRGPVYRASGPGRALAFRRS
ncbi:hypothetical protein [Actinomadura atramentaria]|uniref:hypothetical protein n=1 Tax=Actinomadura atramentaria TaxID=1990 RepID=UPI0003A22683|nr:hypothetical protein [Actinomadura atramentaria]